MISLIIFFLFLFLSCFNFIQFERTKECRFFEKYSINNHNEKVNSIKLKLESYNFFI